MIHFLPDYSPQYDDYSVYFTLNFLSKEECDKIISLKSPIPPASATPIEPNPNIRLSTVNWLEHDKLTDWVFQKIGSKVLEINRLHYGFDISGILEPMQVSEYDGNSNEQYVWHTDFHTKTSLNVQRKISVAINISEDGAYEGGNLENYQLTYPTAAPRDLGALIIYPSYVLNRITPVVKGSKTILNLWIHGPNFR